LRDARARKFDVRGWRAIALRARHAMKIEMIVQAAVTEQKNPG